MEHFRNYTQTGFWQITPFRDFGPLVVAVVCPLHNTHLETFPPSYDPPYRRMLPPALPGSGAGGGVGRPRAATLL